MPAGDITPDDSRQLKLGQVVYDTGGNRLGGVRDTPSTGSKSSARTRAPSYSNTIRGQGLGEGYMIWRSSNCREMGKLQRMSDTCPNCGYGAEFLYAWPRIDRLGERFYALTTN